MAGVQAGRLNIEIVAEIARLQADLDKAKRAVGAASKDIAASARHANDNLAGMGRGALKAGQNSRLASHHMANLSFQLQDIVVGLTSGQKPMTVFLQQGSQIGQIMGQAGVGVGGLAKNIGLMTLNFAKAHPVLIGIGVAAGGAAVGINSLTDEMSEQGKIDQFVAGLGLTKDEMKKLEDQAVTVGDVFKGLWVTIAEVTTLDEKIGGFWQWLKDAAADAGNAVLTAMKYTAAGIYAAFAGSIEAASILYKQLPRAIGDSIITAANFVINTLEKMANKAIGILNAVIGGVNNTFIGEFFGGLPAIAEVSFGQIENSFAGSAARMSADLGGVFSSAFQEGLSGIDSFMSAARDNILQATRDRLAAAAAQIIADRDGAGGKGRTARAKKDLDEFAKSMKAALAAARDFRDGLTQEMMQAELTEIQLRRLEAATQSLALEKLAIVAPTEELRQALLAEADAVQRDVDAWEAWYRARADKSFEQDILQPLRDEIALLGLTGTERERAAMWLQKEALMAEWAAKGMTELNAKWEEFVGLNEQLWAQQDAMAAWEERWGRVRDFLAEVNKTPEQMAAAFDDIKIGGIDRLLDGLSRIPGEVDSINDAFGAMRDVFQGVIQDMIAQLIRLQLQKAIAGLIGAALGGYGGGTANSLGGMMAGMAAGGARAAGGPVSMGSAYRVGEQGPETFVPRVPGYIMPNGANDNGTWNFNITVNSGGKMTDREARRTGSQIASAANQKMAQSRKAGIAG